MLKQRIITSLVGLPVLGGCLYLGGLFLTILCVAAYFVLVYEFLSNVVSLPRRAVVFSMISHGYLVASFFIFGFSGLLCGLWLAIVLQFIGLVVFVENEEHQPFLETLVPGVLAGLVYPGALALPLVIVSTRPMASWAICWLLVLTIASDTFAYFFGKAIGGRKLAVRVSPNKTVSGAIAGFAMALVCGVEAFLYLCPVEQHGVLRAVFLSMVAAVLVQFGDLAESLVKRAYHAKDAGALLPGHGGLLDRIDGLLFASPILLLVVYPF